MLNICILFSIPTERSFFPSTFINHSMLRRDSGDTALTKGKSFNPVLCVIIKL